MLLSRLIKLSYIICLLAFGWLTLTPDQAFAKMCPSALVLVETIKNENSVSKIYKPVNPELCPKGYFKIVGSKPRGYIQRQHELKLAQLQVEKLWLLEEDYEQPAQEIYYSSYTGDTTIENTVESSAATTNTNTTTGGEGGRATASSK